MIDKTLDELFWLDYGQKMPYCITVMESKSKRKIVIIILLIVAVLCLVYVWNFKYSTNITKLENEIINDYSSTDRYLQNYVILGQEKVSEEQTNYFAVAYTNYYKVVDPGVVKMTPYLEKSRKALAGCKADDMVERSNERAEKKTE